MSRHREEKDGKITITIDSMDECKYLYDQVCCNDQCEWCCNYPYGEDCGTKCRFYEKEDGVIKED